MKKIYIMTIFWFVVAVTIMSGCSNRDVTTEKKLEEANKNETLQEKYNYKNPIIPEGFHTVETETASWEKQEDGAIKGWNNGLVIEDDKGNQFVWVPCTVEDNDDVVKYGRYFYEGGQVKNYGEKEIKHATIATTGEVYSYYEDDEKNEEVKDMVKRYGGFFIGRYELGQEGEDIVVKKGCNPVTNIDREQAIELTSNIIQNNNVQTYLMTSFCYDTTVKWIEESNDNFCEDPVKYHNLIENNEVKKTGESEEVNNIYDIFGNVYEITTEKYSGKDNTDNFIYRSGMTKSIRSSAKGQILIDEFCQRGPMNKRSKLIGTRAIIIVK